MGRARPEPRPDGRDDRLFAVDLEIDGGGRLLSAGYCRGGRAEELTDAGWGDAVAWLEERAAGAEYLVGHNVLAHDLPRLAEQEPSCALLRMPVLDTLMLSPLAFPRRPYHRLVKDYKLASAERNDPGADARLSLRVLEDCAQAFGACHASHLALLTEPLYPQVEARQRPEAGSTASAAAEAPADYGTTPTWSPPRRPRAQTTCSDHGGMARWLCEVGARRPVDWAVALLERHGERLCRTAAAARVRSVRPVDRPALAFLAAWLEVEGSGSVLPAWVCHEFPQVSALVRDLRDTACDEPTCRWCQQQHDARGQLHRWFGFEDFRAEPAGPGGASLQRLVVESAMAGRSLLAVLPTGAGKSLCFQVPALARYARTGELTVVLSPLQALMQDQVEGLVARTGSSAVAALNGQLTAPERAGVVERVRLGEVGLLYIAPEQLRGKTCRELLAGRQIGAWVVDEAHCLAQWGHDFRPDYLYSVRFIRELAQVQGVPVPPVQCLTATAKRGVRDQILDNLRRQLGVDVALFEAAVERPNLRFEVREAGQAARDSEIRALVEESLAVDGGAAVVYCATRRRADQLAEFLGGAGLPVVSYHAGLGPMSRRERQQQFLGDEYRVVCATSAFGMGIDKPDVRLVLHDGMPGSLESYLQEAGRAGRDQQVARCVLLHSENDAEVQFRLLRHAQLVHRDLAALLRAIRARRRGDHELLVTPGELLDDEELDVSFDVEDRHASTRVKTAVAWLERAGMLSREENVTSLIQAKPIHPGLAPVEAHIERHGVRPLEAALWLAVYERLLHTAPDEVLDTDQLAGAAAFQTWERLQAERQESRRWRLTAGQKVLRVLHDMAKAKLVSTDTRLTAFVRDRVVDPSDLRLRRVSVAEQALLGVLRELAPDLGPEQGLVPLSVRGVAQRLRDDEVDIDAMGVLGILRSLSLDGRGLAGGHGSLQLRHRGGDAHFVALERSWTDVVETSKRRLDVARVVLDTILAAIDKRLPPSKERLAEFSLEQLVAAVQGDLLLRDLKDPLAAVERALLYMHEREVLALHRGLAVFRSAMTLRLPSGPNRRYTKGDFGELQGHYDEQARAVHTMARYADEGARDMDTAGRLVADYFALPPATFRRRWFPDANGSLTRRTTAASHRRIVEELGDAQQQALVTASVETSLLVLAGPGSGKTRVVVHRCAWLIKEQGVRPGAILLACFNRATARELRRRVVALAGDDARGVMIGTYYSLAARLLGRSFADRRDRAAAVSEQELAELLREAASVLRGGSGGEPGAEPDVQRDRLLAGFSHILVDEYQDIDRDQYDFVAALAGRGVDDSDQRLALLAVGDDDQAIYGWRRADLRFIAKFQDDYGAERHELSINYRSTRAIVAAANQVILGCSTRLKQRPLQVPETRRDEAWGGVRPAPGGGLVRCVRVEGQDASDAGRQALVVAELIEAIRAGEPDLPAREIAVLGRDHRSLQPVAAWCRERGIPVCLSGAGEGFSPLALREARLMFGALAAEPAQETCIRQLRARFESLRAGADPSSPWWGLLASVVDDWHDELGERRFALEHFRVFAREQLAEARREHRLEDGVVLATLHSAKGLEFDHVIVLGGRFDATGRQERDEARRLYYVGMTRARRGLTLLDTPATRVPYLRDLSGEQVAREVRVPEVLAGAATTLARQIRPLGLAELDLGFLGRQAPQDAGHAAIRRLGVGDPLGLRVHRDHVELCASCGTPVARLAGDKSGEWADLLPRLLDARVRAILGRSKAQEAPEYQRLARSDDWELPIVEVTLAGAGD